MARFSFVTVDVFTDKRFGGNPLAVFPDARGMSDADMQSLAAEFNLSETTFVLPPADPANTARVRIFNRRAEMPFAGHPNVGTGWVLAQTGPRQGRHAALRGDRRPGRDRGRSASRSPSPRRSLCRSGRRCRSSSLAACVGLEASDVSDEGASSRSAPPSAIPS